MNKEAAEQVLYTEVYVPAFLQKCAQLGLAINNEQDAVLALENAALVKAACEQVNSQMNQPVLKAANETLRAVLGVNAEPQTQSVVSDNVKSAIATLNS